VAKGYNGVYTLQPLYAFADEPDELLHVEVRSGNTHPGAKAVSYLRRLKKKIPSSTEKIYLRSDSAFYNREVVDFCEEEGWEFSIIADQTALCSGRLMHWPRMPGNKILRMLRSHMGNLAISR
jgi:hypothetical protein